jgi:tight adherence protein B
MATLLTVVFVGAFVVVFLLFLALSSGSQRDVEKTMVRLNAISVVSVLPSSPEVTSFVKEETFSNIPWLNDLLQSFNVLPTVKKILRQSGLQWEVASLLLTSILLWILGAVGVYLRSRSVIISSLLGALVAMGPWLWALHKRHKRFLAFEETLPEALDLLVSAIRAGHGFTSALGLASRELGEPIAGELKQCFDEQNFGLDLRRAMESLVARVPIADVRLIVSAVLIQKESGGNLAEILEKVAHIIRERFRLKRQIRVHTAQGRLTGWILSFAPVIFGILLYLLNPDRMSVLWTRPIGVKLIWLALFMEATGALIIRKIVRPRV